MVKQDCKLENEETVHTICCGMAALADSKTKLIEMLNDANKSCKNLQMYINKKQVYMTQVNIEQQWGQEAYIV